jgi:uncharacterized membrane protein
MMWDWGTHWMPFWPIFMIGMIVLCIVMMSMMMRGGGMHPPWRQSFGDVGKTARDILDERCARGEIDKAEYEIKRHDMMA